MIYKSDYGSFYIRYYNQDVLNVIELFPNDIKRVNNRMNIDEGRTALWFADTLLPIKSWKEVLYVGACPDTFQKWGGDFFLKYIMSLGAIFKCTIVEKHRPYAEEIQSRTFSLIKMNV